MTAPIKYQVYQRGKDGKATIPLGSGDTARVRVLKGRKTAIPWHRTEGEIKGVPVGGPYTIEIEPQAGRAYRVGGVLVGDLWVLAGQSNMDGCGKLVDLEPPSRMVHCFYYDETWGIARDPLCRLVDSIDPVHWPCPEAELAKAREEDHKFREAGAGLGVRFGKEVHKATGVPVGLVMCSHGGTSIEQWDPKLKNEGGRSLYGSVLRRIGVCGGRVAGMLWYQGESNGNAESSAFYKERMKSFIKAVRRDLKSPGLPFIQVQIGRVLVDETAFPPEDWNRIQEVQLEIASEMQNVGVAAAVDCGLSDAIHLDALGGRRMGSRLAELALVMAYGKKGPASLAPGKIAFADRKRACLRVQYRNVRGRLAPRSGVFGFWVEDRGGRVAIVNATAAGDSVELRLERSALPGARLWYGRGCNPTVNLRDQVFAAPVFGPVRV